MHYKKRFFKGLNIRGIAVRIHGQQMGIATSLQIRVFFFGEINRQIHLYFIKLKFVSIKETKLNLREFFYRRDIFEF